MRRVTVNDFFVPSSAVAVTAIFLPGISAAAMPPMS